MGPEEVATRASTTEPVNLERAVLRSHCLSEMPGIRHGITSRVPGIDHADGNAGYAPPRDVAAAWRMRQMWAEAIGVSARSMVLIRQVHGAGVAVVTRNQAGRGAAPASNPLGYFDALITREPGIVLTTLHADCLAILLHDPATGAIGTVHAGWRSTVAQVATATIDAMRQKFDADPSTIQVFLGPSIRDCCYRVGTEVCNEWLQVSSFSGAISRRENHTYFDLPAANRALLLQAGVQSHNIEDSEICTMCSQESWFSHRAQGAETGRFAAMIAIKE